MSKNVLIAFFQALGRKDMEAALALVDPEAEFIAVRPEPSPELALYGTYSGHDGVRRYFARLAEAFEPQKVRATGRPFDSAWAVVCRLKGGRIAHYRFFEDTAALHTAFGVYG